MSPPSASPSLRPPRQERSRRTLRRILDALEGLLEEHRFEAISVHEVARRAGVSIGSLYARFPSKDALLPALYERWDDQVRSLGHRSKRIEEARTLSLEDLAYSVVRAMATRNRKKHAFMRAVALHARLHPEQLDEPLRRRRRALHKVWVDLFLEHRDRIRHPDPERAVQLGLFMVSSTVREKIVFADAPHASSFRISDRQLVEEVTRMLLAYLGVPAALGNQASKRRPR